MEGFYEKFFIKNENYISSVINNNCMWVYYLDINLLKGVVFNNNSYAGTIVFCVSSGIVICLLAYFLTGKAKKVF